MTSSEKYLARFNVIKFPPEYIIEAQKGFERIANTHIGTVIPKINKPNIRECFRLNAAFFEMKESCANCRFYGIGAHYRHHNLI